MDVNLREVLSVLAAYKGRILGLFFGALIGLVAAKYGFWAGALLALCLLLGYFVGKRFDSKDSLRDIIERILPPSD